MRNLPMVLCFLLAILAYPHLAGASDRSVVNELRMAGDASRARVLAELDGEAGFNWFLLRNPHRLVIDLSDTEFAVDEEAVPRGLVTELRHGSLQDKVSRLIITTDGPFAVEQIDLVENESSEGYRLVTDLVAASETDFESALAGQVEATGTTRATRKTDRLAQPEGENRRFTIVIDPGHGGVDGGAQGIGGTREKTITLAFALELKAHLEEAGDYDVHLTRERDEFLRLDERVRIARQHRADLFLSIHADAIGLSRMRGATVYTVADRPSDAQAAARAIRENLADEAAGEESRPADDKVTDILVDLVRRETQGFSLRFARSLVGELSSSIEMVGNPHRYAGFQVLRAPDVPSVLLELGYLSNAEDEAQMRDPEWRQLAIESLETAIESFAEGRSGWDG